MHIYVKKRTNDEVFHYILNGDLDNKKITAKYGYLLYQNTKDNLRAYLYNQNHNVMHINKEDTVKILTDQEYNDIYRKMLKLEYKHDIPESLI